jgi:hypothetical protein
MLAQESEEFISCKPSLSNNFKQQTPLYLGMSRDGDDSVAFCQNDVTSFLSYGDESNFSERFDEFTP